MCAYVCLSVGENEKPCVVTLLDDSIHEDDEEFRLVLGTPKSKSKYGAALGEQKETLVTITDKKDSEFTKSVLMELAKV